MINNIVRLTILSLPNNEIYVAGFRAINYNY